MASAVGTEGCPAGLTSPSSLQYLTQLPNLTPILPQPADNITAQVQQPLRPLTACRTKFFQAHNTTQQIQRNSNHPTIDPAAWQVWCFAVCPSSLLPPALFSERLHHRGSQSPQNSAQKRISRSSAFVPSTNEASFSRRLDVTASQLPRIVLGRPPSLISTVNCAPKSALNRTAG